MSSEKASNASSSDTTSSRAPTGSSDSAKKSSAKPTESQILQQEADRAKAAIKNTVSQIGKELGESVNLGNWTRQYPWTTLGAATIAGFVAATLAVPSKQQQALRRLRKIEEALTPRHEPVEGNGHDKVEKGEFGSGLGGFLAKQAAKALPSILSAVSVALTNKANPPPTGDQASDPSNPDPSVSPPS